MIDEKLTELIKIVLSQESNIDSLELGEAKRRVKVYFNASKPEDAKLKIQNAIDVAKWGEQYNNGIVQEEMK